MARVSIVDFGKALQRQGWNVAEHSAFGGVTPGVHSAKGHHPHDEALDITWKNNQYGDYDPSGKIGWRNYTQQLGEKLSLLRGADGNYLQALHPGNDPNHSTHTHLGVTGGYLDLTPEQMQEFGIENPETIGIGDLEQIKKNLEREDTTGNVLNVYFDRGSQHQDKKDKAKSLVEQLKEGVMMNMVSQALNPLAGMGMSNFDPYQVISPD